LVRTSWLWRTWTAAPSPSAMEECSAPCLGLLSSTRLSRPFWACMASLTGPWPSLE
ncbi:hypothetical protein M9458_035423, partial [Cirrhinus mrigala]